MTKYTWTCGLPIWDEDGEWEDWAEVWSGTIETDVTDPDSIKSLCANNFSLKKYGNKKHHSDDECELMLDNLVYEKEEA